MAGKEQFQLIFNELQALMQPFAESLVVTRDRSDDFCVDTQHVMKNGKPLFFGAVRIGKRYVSYHLMPVYVNPALLDGISDQLRSRMQGKSCFNFVTLQAELFTELGGLTAAGYEDYRRRGFVG
jgi:hypothetical protein